MGDNRPPRPVLHELAKADFAEAIEAQDGVEKRIAELVDSASSATAVDDETAGRCTHLLRQMKAVVQVVEREREAVKAPFLEGGRIIDDAARAMLSRLIDAKISVEEKHRDYVRAKQRAADEKRRAAAERQRQQINESRAAEGKAEIAAAAMPVASRQAAPVKLRSEFGGTATATRQQIAIITDWSAAFDRVKGNPKVQDAVQKAIDRLVKAGETELPGVELADDVGVRVS